MGQKKNILKHNNQNVHIFSEKKITDKSEKCSKPQAV